MMQGSPYSLSHVLVVRTSHFGLSSHPPNHLVYYYLADNRDRCLTNNTTDNDQRPGPPVHRCLPCRPVKARGYRQGEPSLYLVSRVLWVELDFRGFGNSRGKRSGAKHTGTLVIPSLSSRRNTSRGHRWVARILPLWTAAVQDPMAARQSQPRVEYKDYSLIAHT